MTSSTEAAVEQQQLHQAPLDYARYYKAKHEEWSTKGMYLRGEKIAQLMADPQFCSLTWPPGPEHFYSFDAQSPCGAQFAETLRLLGWTGVDAATDARATDRLDVSKDSLLLAGPEAVAAMRQRTDFSRYARCLAYWEQRLHCLANYWQLCDTLQDYERSLQALSQMGLLAEPAGGRRPLSCQDFLLPTVHLGEAWGKRLAKFFRAHEASSFQVRCAKAPAGGCSDCGACCCGCGLCGRVYVPTERSGRKRLEGFEAFLLDCGDQGAGFTKSDFVLQARPSLQPPMSGPGGRREFTLETFLLVAPRRNPEFGFAAFFHRGLVRMVSSQHSGHVSTWLPEQLADYLGAISASQRDWLEARIYPRLEAACAYLATALCQQLGDSSHIRWHLLRLSFALTPPPPPSSLNADADSSCDEPRLTSFSQRLAWRPKALDFCESLVLPRLTQEAALIVAELLVKSSRADQQALPACQLVARQNMQLVFDSVQPRQVQRAILMRLADAAGSGVVADCGQQQLQP